MENKANVALFNGQQAGIIVQLPSGIDYRTWVGVPCARSFSGWEERCIEGIFLPVSNDAPEGCPTLEESLKAAWGGKDEFSLNQILAEISSSDVIVVDRRRLDEAVAGWLPVRVEPQGDFSLLGGVGPVDGVLVWPSTFWSLAAGMVSP